MRRWTTVLGAFTTMAIVAAGCGDDDDTAEPDTSEVADTAGDTTAATTAEGAVETTQLPATTETAGTGEGGTTEPTEDGECANQGGEITYALRNSPPGFDPRVAGTVGTLAGTERVAVFDTLMQYDPESGEVSPRMAESLEANDDLTEYTLTLRDGVTFANGEPVTTEAVAFSVDLHRAPDTTSQSKAAASLIAEMEIVDDQTMVFHLSSPYGDFPALLAGAVGLVIHPATFQELGPEAFASDPQGAGAGPFVLESWAAGTEMVLTAREDYWGGRPCIDTLRITYGLADDTKIDAVSLGEVDVALVRTPQEVARAEEEGLQSMSNFGPSGYTLWINNGARGQTRIGSDPRVREAIVHAIDVDVVNERGFGGAGVPDTKLIPETSPLHSEGLEGPAYDPELARSLLDEVKAEGYDGSLFFLCNTTYAEPAITIEALLEEVGFNVELEAGLSVQDWSQRLVQTADYDIACGSTQLSDARPWETMSAHFSGVGENSFLVGYDSDEMVAALEVLKGAGTPEERQAAWADVQRVWNETYPSAVYGHAEEAVIWGDSVEGLDMTLETIVLFDEASTSG